MAFNVSIKQRDPGVFAVTVSGSLDTTTYEQFEREVNLVLVKKPKVVLLDLGGVNYVSSMGIGSVFKITNAIKANKGTLILTNLQPKIQKVFDIVKALPGAIFKSIEEADAYLDQIQKNS